MFSQWRDKKVGDEWAQSVKITQGLNEKDRSTVLHVSYYLL